MAAQATRALTKTAKRAGTYEFQIKRVYEPPAPEDGFRFLVDRLWPRGIQKKSLLLTGWNQAVAPSTPLRKWFGHEIDKWAEFRRRYRLELENNAGAWQPFLAAIQNGNVTLLFAAQNVEMNQAVVLRDFLKAKRKQP